MDESLQGAALSAPVSPLPVPVTPASPDSLYPQEPSASFPRCQVSQCIRGARAGRELEAWYSTDL